MSRRLEFTLDDLHEPAKLDQLRDVFRGSERLRPGTSPQAITPDAAERFGGLGRRLQERGHDPRAVAHFLNRVVFCLFAEHAGILAGKPFVRMVKALQARPRLAKQQLEALFATMGEGGFFGADAVLRFNGGLFDDAEALPLESDDLRLIADSAAEHDWAEIDPSIFGTLFEEALKAERRRAALGAHYTDRVLPRDAAAAAAVAELKKRTLTNLYNARPAWLDMAHRRLDAAVAAAYGWPADLPDEEVLARLFALNGERAAER